MMSCHEASEGLVDAVFGELDDHAEALLNEHLRACSGCRGAEADLLRLKERLHEGAADVPPALEARLRTAVHRAVKRAPAESARARTERPSLRSWLRKPVPAYAMLAAVFLTLYVQSLLAPDSRVRVAAPVVLRESGTTHFVTAIADETSLGVLNSAAAHESMPAQPTPRDSI